MNKGALLALLGVLATHPQEGEPVTLPDVIVPSPYGDLSGVRGALALDTWSCVPRDTCRGV